MASLGGGVLFLMSEVPLYHIPRLLRGVRGPQLEICARQELSPSCICRNSSAISRRLGPSPPLQAPALHWRPAQLKCPRGNSLRAQGPALLAHSHSAPVLAGSAMQGVWTWVSLG